MRAFMIFILSLPILLAATYEAEARNLQKICDYVDSSDKICDVYFANRDKNWGEVFSDFFDPNTFDKSVAVVIAIGEYEGDNYRPLSGRREDAERMRELLIEEGAFDIVVTLIDRAANKDQIEILMTEDIPKLLGEKDRFLFYFSGHGETRKLADGRRDRGYLVMGNATGEDNYSNMISMGDVQEWSLNVARARQSLWLIDACFSGLASPETMGRAMEQFPSEVAETTRRRLAQRGHHMWTAGIDDENSLIVDGRSVFTNAFIDAVKRGDLPSGGQPPDGFISLTEIEAYLVKAVDREVAAANQRDLRGRYKMSPRRTVLHADDGQFFFLDRAAFARSSPEPSVDLPSSVTTGGAAPQPEAPRAVAKQRVVDFSGRGDYWSLGAAVKAASPGDIIQIRPGRYFESIKIEKSLEIVGDGDRSMIVLESGHGATLTLDAPSGRISGLTIRQATAKNSNGAVNIRSGQIILERNDISSENFSGVVVSGDAAPVISNNKIHESGESGILLLDDSKAVIEQNDISTNALAGITIIDRADPMVKANRIHNGRLAGIFVGGYGRGQIQRNEIFSNANAGVQIKQHADPFVSKNKIRDGAESGIYVHEEGKGRIEENHISRNNLAGIEIATGANPRVEGNTIEGGRHAGIYIIDQGHGEIIRNRIIGNALAGIVVEGGSSPTVLENSINHNIYQAIWLRSTATGDFRDNDLRDNGRGPWLIEPGVAGIKRLGNQE